MGGSFLRRGVRKAMKPVRAELVRRFNGGEVSVFLISLRAGGTGLNLS